MATDKLPTVSPDGRTLAYFAMARAGYEADRQVLMLRDLARGTVRPLTQSWDRSVGSIAWARDGRSLLVTAEDTLEAAGVPHRRRARGAVTRLTGDGHFGNVQPLPGGGAIATMNSIMAPDDLYRLDAARPPDQADQCQPRTARPARPGDLPEVQLRRRQQRHESGAGR